MIFITKLKLINFQSHEQSTFEFDRGLNVILGNSDSGKTAVLRAIKWALYNEPLGSYFIREGSKEVSVTVFFNTGAIIKRYRSTSKNTYYLKKSNGEEFNFDGFGINVPKEIEEEIGMYKINLSDKETSIINISEQLEGPFLLNEKPSLRASAIGRLIGVNYIDDALRDTIRDNKVTNSEIKSLNIEKGSLSEELKEFDYIPESEKLLKILKDIKLNIVKYQNLMFQMEELKKKYFHTQNEIKDLISTLEKYKNIDNLNNKYNHINLIVSKYLKFLKMNQSLKTFNENISLNQNLLSSVSNLEEAEKKYSALEYKTIQFVKINRLYKSKKDISIEINKISSIVDNLNNLNYGFEIKNKLNNIIKKYNFLINIKEQYLNIEEKLNIGSDYLFKFKDIEKLNNILYEIEQKNILLTFIKNKHYSYSTLNQEIEILNAEAINQDLLFNSKLEEYNNVFLDIGYCPLCHSVIDESTIEHIKDHYKEKI